jgi:hypothetical protein
MRARHARLRDSMKRRKDPPSERHALPTPERLRRAAWGGQLLFVAALCLYLACFHVQPVSASVSGETEHEGVFNLALKNIRIDGTAPKINGGISLRELASLFHFKKCCQSALKRALTGFVGTNDCPFRRDFSLTGIGAPSWRGPRKVNRIIYFQQNCWRFSKVLKSICNSDSCAEAAHLWRVGPQTAEFSSGLVDVVMHKLDGHMSAFGAYERVGGIPSGVGCDFRYSEKTSSRNPEPPSEQGQQSIEDDQKPIGYPLWKIVLPCCILASFAAVFFATGLMIALAVSRLCSGALDGPPCLYGGACCDACQAASENPSTRNANSAIHAACCSRLTIG